MPAYQSRRSDLAIYGSDIIVDMLKALALTRSEKEYPAEKASNGKGGNKGERLNDTLGLRALFSKPQSAGH